MRWFWGLLILSFGLIFLGLNLNFYDSVSASVIFQFWPLILILFGIALIFKNIKFGWILILLSFVLALVFIHYYLINQTDNLFLDLNFLNNAKLRLF